MKINFIKVSTITYSNKNFCSYYETQYLIIELKNLNSKITIKSDFLNSVAEDFIISAVVKTHCWLQADS